MTRATLNFLVFALLLFSASMSAHAAIIEVHRWNLGDDDAGAVNGGSANNPSTAAVGGFNLTKVGSPTYVTTPSGLGVDFNNPGANHDVAASDYFENTAFSFTPTDPAKTAAHARVKLDAIATGESAVLHSGFGNSAGIILQTDHLAGGLWALHIPGSAIFTGGSQANAVGQYLDLVLVTNGAQLQLYENTNLVIDINVGSFAAGAQEDIRIGASNNAGNVTRGWGGQIDFVRVLEYTGTFDINAVLNPVPEPATGSLLVAGTIGMLALRRRRSN